MKNSTDAVRHTVDARIAELIKEQAHVTLDDVPSSGLMRGVIEQALRSSKGGKRLRALLTIAAGAVTSGNSEDTAQTRAADLSAPAPARRQRPLTDRTIIDIACAIEIFQTGALVHDDIIDDSDTRRGVPAAHKGLNTVFRSFASSIDAASLLSTTPSAQQQTCEDIGTGLGIMLGDLLATMSLGVVSQAAATGLARLHEAVVTAFLEMQKEVEIGQVLDVADTAVPLDRPDLIIKNCLSVFRWKTASYTTIAPLRLGFLCAGFAPDTAKTWAQRIGSPLGTAFQLADDLIDVQREHSTSGKPLGGDIKEGKRTVLLADALAHSTEADRKVLTDVYSKETRDDSDISPVIDIFERSGAIERSLARIETLWNSSTDEIAAWQNSLAISAADTSHLVNTSRLFLPQIHTR